MLISPLLIFGGPEILKGQTPSLEEYVKYPYPVAFLKRDAPIVGSAANKLSKELRGLSASPGDANEVCDIWFEGEMLRGNGQEGYTVLIQPAGAIVRATSETQAMLAVARILSVVKRAPGGDVLLPRNLLLTNYPVFPSVEK